jgi:phosphatidylinositol alpha-1,6-mannosyltransferase
VPRGLSVLALVTDAFGGYGGIAQYNRDLLQALADSAIVERVVALPRIAKGGADGPPSKVVQSAPRFGRLSYSLNALATARRDGPFDVVFCGHLYHAPLAAALCRIIGARMWLQTHGIDAWERPSPLVRASADRAELVTAVSRCTRRRVLEWTTVRPERVRVLPNTVRSTFSPGLRSEATLAKFGLSGAKILLTVSRVDKVDAYKGHDRVIKAMAKVRRAEPDALYVVVGDGDGRADLQALTERSGLTDAVRFLGRLSDEDVLALYRSADAFIMPSMKEGFGIVFVEAGACGLPVIAGNRDGSVDALADGQFGRLVDPLSQDEIVGALIDILRRRPPAAVEAVQRFSYPQFAKHVDALVRTLAA